MNRQTIFRVVLGLIVVAVLAAAGFAVFNAGAAYGVAQSPEWARLAEEGVRPGNMGPWMMQGGPHMMGYGWGWRPFGWGFGLLSCLIPFFFVFLVFALFRGLFGWGRWGGWRGGPGGWGRGGDWEQRRQEMFDEWHKRAHGGGEQPQQQS